MRATKSVTSSGAKALSSDSMGTPWRTGANWLEIAAPTTCDGESAMVSSGNRLSISSARRFSASYSASEISGASSV